MDMAHIVVAVWDDVLLLLLLAMLIPPVALSDEDKDSMDNLRDRRLV